MLDSLFIDVSKKENIDPETTKRIIQFIKTHQFDTDSFRYDLNTNDNNKQSNLCNISNQNMEFISISNQCMSSRAFDNMYSTMCNK